MISAELPEDDDQLNALSSHLCELKESQIRSGLHIFGQLPEGEKKIDFLLSLLRMPSVERPGLLQALLGKGSDFDLDTLSIRKRDEIEERARQWIKDELAQGETTFDSALAPTTTKKLADHSLSESQNLSLSETKSYSLSDVPPGRIKLFSG